MTKKKSSIVVAPTAEVADYLLTQDDFKKTMSIIAENVGNEGINQFDLTRAENPSGKSTKWEIPSLFSDDTESVGSVEGVIIYHKNVRAYWPEGYGEGGTDPQCNSADTVTGEGEPGGACLDCPLAKWGSGVDKDGNSTRGQACTTRKHMFLIRPDERLPMMFSLPPTSLKSARMFFLELGNKDIQYWHIISRLSLEQSTKGGNPHSIFQFSMVGMIPDDAQEVMDKLRTYYTPWLSQSVAAVEDKPEGEEGPW